MSAVVEAIEDMGQRRRPRGRLGVWLWRLAVPADRPLRSGSSPITWGSGSRALLPSPGTVWEATVSLHSSGALWSNLSSTLGAAIEALALSALVGTPLGVVLGMLPRVWEVLGPYLNALNSMPRIALAPCSSCCSG